MSTSLPRRALMLLLVEGLPLAGFLAAVIYALEHGVTRLDGLLFGGALIWLLEKAGLAWDVHRATPEAVAARALRAEP